MFAALRKCNRMLASLALAVGCANIALFVRAQAQGLTVTASFADRTIPPGEQITLNLSRALHPSEGKIAVLIGVTDMTALFALSPDALVYTPQIPLPAGESAVAVYLVAGDNNWREIARFTLSIGEVQPSEPQEQSAPEQNGSQKRKVDFTPSLTIGLKSQVAEYHFPASVAPERERFTDFTLQGSLRMETHGARFNSQMQFDVAGSSYRREALRFAQEGELAPRIDLASYLVQFQVGKARFQAGHIAFGTNRHLISSFSSRGVSLTLPVTSRADFSLAAMNGSSIVGWDNFLGLDRRKHQIVSGTLGFEFIRERPGGLRIEGGLMHGSLLPISNFNQGNITDAEQSRGASIRVVASDTAQRIRLEAGFARSRFNNPSDPLLEQSFNVVPVRETSRNARYIDTSFDIVRDRAISATRKANLTINYRHETVDPLFRSVAAYTQADRFQNQIEAVASIADVTITASHLRFNDNLDDVPSILKTLTRRTGVIIGAPLASLLSDPAKPSQWWPRVSYSFDRTHQFGAALPINSGFSISHVPDQTSANQGALADWQFQKARFGYRFNRSFQDNRQPGRERADLRNLINGFTLGLTPHNAIDLNFDVSLESAKNFETLRIDNTNRVGANINWRINGRMNLAATLSTLFAGDRADTSRSRNAEFDLQWSYRFAVERSRYRKAQGQFFIRYANRYAYALDDVFRFNNLTRIQSLNLGLSFTFF
ncbi:MAG: hypothetical protein AB1631_20010 [Acidobacteriota bacterium]